MSWEQREERNDASRRCDRVALALVILLWVFHAVCTYLWLSANQFAVGWDRPKHLVTTLIFDQLLQHVDIQSLFQVFSLNLGYYPPLFPLSVVPLYRVFGVSADVAALVNVFYMLILLLSLYGIGRRLYDTRTGLLAAFLGSMSPFLFSMAHYTYIDYALTAMITLAVYLLLCTDTFRSAAFSVLFGVVLGLGMLYKWTPLLFVSGPLLLAVIRMVKTDVVGEQRRPLRLGVPWLPFAVGAVAGLVLTWLWYTPNADLAATLLLGNWLPVLSVVIIGLTVFLLLLPAHPLCNLLKALAVAALFTAFWYLPRADMFRDIVSIVVGGRADRPDYFDLSAYVYYPHRLIHEGWGWPVFGILVVLFVAAVYRLVARLLGERTPAQGSRWVRRADVFVLFWFLFPFIAATFSTHREVRSVLPLMAPLVVAAAHLMLGIREITLRRVVVVAVCLLLVVQFAVLNLGALSWVAQATEIDNVPVIGKVGLFAYGDHIQWANQGGHDDRYWIVPDVLSTMTEDFHTPGHARIREDAVVLGLLLNSRAVNEYNIDYLVRTEYPDVVVDNLCRNRDLYPLYVRIFGCDYLLMRDEPDSSEPAELVRTVIADPPQFFRDNFSLVKKYPWPDGTTLYLFKNVTHRIPAHFGGDWLAPVTVAVETDLGNELRLLGYSTNTAEIASTGKLLITLYWLSLEPAKDNYSMRLKLLNGVRHVWGQQEGRPRWDASLTSQWTKGQVVEDIREISVFPGTPPGSYAIELLVTGLHAGRPLEPADGGELLLGPVDLPRGPTPHPASLDVDRLLDARFADQITLLGYKAESGYQPGDGLHLTLYWRAERDIDQDFVVFNHLVGEDGSVYTQKDSTPVDGYYPTTQWSAGEVIRDRYDLVIPVDAPLQTYTIMTGLYLPETGQRLPLIGEDGQISGDMVQLHRFEIAGE